MKVVSGSINQLKVINQGIQNIKFNLDESEQILVRFIIKNTDTSTYNKLEYEYSFQDVFQDLDIHESTEKAIRNIKLIFKKLRDKSLLITENEVETAVSWINKVSFKDDRIIIRQDEDMNKYLVMIKTNFTDERLGIILKYKSQYAVRLYNIMNYYGKPKNKTFKLDELKTLLMVENIITYESFKEFRKYVLNQAIKEINEYSDLLMEYETIMSGNKIIKINFICKQRINMITHKNGQC